MNKRLIFGASKEQEKRRGLTDAEIDKSLGISLNTLDSRTGAPWYNYVGAMLIGWAIAAFVYTY